MMIPRRSFLGILPAALAWRPALAQDDGLVKAIGEVIRESAPRTWASPFATSRTATS